MIYSIVWPYRILGVYHNLFEESINQLKAKKFCIYALTIRCNHMYHYIDIETTDLVIVITEMDLYKLSSGYYDLKQN